MAERRLQGLQRVLGVNALFSTAYGNVGSSIYYALGLVASFALGLTPVVFVLTGVIFYLTAATYSEATAMFPEAGGSSSLRPARLQRVLVVLRRLGPDAQLHDHDRDLRVLRAALHRRAVLPVPEDLAGRHLLRHRRDRRCCAGSTSSASPRPPRSTSLLAVTDFATQLLLVLVGAVPRVLDRTSLIHNVHLGVRADVEELPRRDPGRDDRLHRDRDDLEHGRGGEGRGDARSRAAINRVVIAVFAIYAALPAVALSALPVRCTSGGKCQTLLGVSEDKGGFAGDPVLGIVKHLHLGALQHAGEVYVGLLAATILFIATNAGIIGVSRLVYSMGLHRQVPDALAAVASALPDAVDRDHRVRRDRVPDADSGPGGRSSATCTRSARCCRSRSRTSRSSGCASPTRTASVRTGVPERCGSAGTTLPLFAIVGGLGTFLAFVTVTVLHVAVAIAGVGWLCYRRDLLYIAYRHRQGLDLVTTTKVAIPRPATDTEAEYDVGPGRVRRAWLRPRGDGDRRADGRAASAAGSMCSSRSRSRRAVRSTRGCPQQEALATSIIEEARVQIGRRVSGHWEKVRAGQTGRRIIDEARAMHAGAIVMPMARSGTGFGRTLETVLKERPCRVIIESTPSKRPRVAAIARRRVAMSCGTTRRTDRAAASRSRSSRSIAAIGLRDRGGRAPAVGRAGGRARGHLPPRRARDRDPSR